MTKKYPFSAKCIKCGAVANFMSDDPEKLPSYPVGIPTRWPGATEHLIDGNACTRGQLRDLKKESFIADTTEYAQPCTGNTLLCPVGLPRSGKSTWARELGVPIVCPDAIRLALTGRRWFAPIEHEAWATAKTMVRSLFFAGHKIVVVDATNWTRRSRDNFRPTPDCDWTREFIWFHATPETCKERAEKTYPDLIEVIDRFAELGCDEISPEEEGQFVTRAYVEQLCKGKS